MHMSKKLLLSLQALLLAFVLLVDVKLCLAEAVKSTNYPSQAEWRYSMRPGDNLIHFARQHLNNPDDWRILQKINKIKNPYRMQLGQTLRVPLHLVKLLIAPAEVVLSSGTAGILKTDKRIEPVIAGQQLAAGTELATADKGQLNIQFADGTIVSMQPN